MELFYMVRNCRKLFVIHKIQSMIYATKWSCFANDRKLCFVDRRVDFGGIDRRCCNPPIPPYPLSQVFERQVEVVQTIYYPSARTSNRLLKQLPHVAT